MSIKSTRAINIFEEISASSRKAHDRAAFILKPKSLLSDSEIYTPQVLLSAEAHLFD